MAEKELADDKATEIEVEQTEDVEALQHALAEQKKEAEKYLANWQRAQADLINYRKHTEQEKQEVSNFANSTLILNLLPIIDDFERAFTSIPSELAELDWIKGIKIIYNNLKTALEKSGVTEVKAKGEQFDPHLHEAVMCQAGEEGMVLEEVRKGYKLKDKVIRPSLVVVGEDKASSKFERSEEERKKRRRKRDG